METLACNLDDLLAAAAPGLMESAGADAVPRRLLAFQPCLLLLADADGVPVEIFDEESDCASLAASVALECARRLRQEMICRFQHPTARCLQTVLATRLPVGGDAMIVACVLGPEAPGDAAGEAEGAWSELIASLVARVAADVAERARLLTRIRHFRAEHDTLRAAHAEATATAIEEREERLEAEQEHARQLQRDIAERKRAQEELKRLHLQNEMILNSAGEGICGLDRNGCAMFVNPAAAHMLGYQPGNLIGVQLHDTIHHSRADGAPNLREQCLMCRALKGQLAARVDTEVFWRADGTPFPVEYTATPIQEGGAVVGAVITFRDISEQRLLEAQLRQAQKLESIGQLAAGIAHEINTPTQYIGDNTRFLGDAFADVGRLLYQYGRLLEAAKTGAIDSRLIEEVDKAAGEADLDFITKEVPSAIRESLDGVEQVTKIVRSMKEFSHPGSSDKGAVNLNEAIRSTLAVSRNEWKYVADVVTEFDERLPDVMCLISDVNQVLLNLIVNAAHAIGERLGPEPTEKGIITVRTRVKGDSVEVCIADTGTGIAPAILNRIFDPFFTTKEVGRGTGQGLAIAHSIITDRHGGSIRVESEVGRGTEFILALPIQPEEEHHAANPVCR